MLKQFTVGCSHTRNLGNFESIRIEAQVVIEVDGNRDLETQKAGAQAQLRDLLVKTWEEQYVKPRQAAKEAKSETHLHVQSERGRGPERPPLGGARDRDL